MFVITIILILFIGFGRESEYKQVNNRLESLEQWRKDWHKVESTKVDILESYESRLRKLEAK